MRLNDGRLQKDISEKVKKDADSLFKMIGEAYDVLSNTAKVCLCHVISCIVPSICFNLLYNGM